jgi:hypothetical protein
VNHRVGNKFNFKHGHTHRDGKTTPTYYAWVDMRRRCSNTKHPAYKWYGARGINYCQRWDSFENFLADMGEKPEGSSLDRIDNNGNYQPGNCRWATGREQQVNRRSNVFLTLNGKTQTMEDWSRETGIGQTTLSYRRKAGWSAHEMLTTKPRGKHAR